LSIQGGSAIISTVDEDADTVDILHFWNATRDPDNLVLWISICEPEGFELPNVPKAADTYDARFLPPIEHRRFREN
jgi:hypothetical protein